MATVCPTQWRARLIPTATVIVEFMRGDSQERQGVGTIIFNAIKSLLRHPVIVAMIVGIGFGFTGWELPGTVNRLVEMLANAATPAALCALGASLTQFSIAGDIRESITLVLLKLLALPALVWFFTAQVFQADPLWVAVATVNAAMPVGINAFLLAQYYGTYTQRSASAALIGTALSLFTLSALFALIGI